MKFSEISNTQDLVRYLSSASRQQKSFYHYTSLEAYEKILESGLWFLSSFEDLNDAYEADRIDPIIKESTFVASFSRNESESIAMWAMYAAPHSQGVRIEIPSKILKRWIKEITVARDILKDEKSVNSIGNMMIPIQKAIIHTITYYEPNKKKFYWSNQALFIHKNKNFINFESDLITHGFIKHAAWAYEEEMRVSVRIDNCSNVQKIAIPVPNYVFENTKIMVGPTFSLEFKGFDSNYRSELYGKVNFK